MASEVNMLDLFIQDFVGTHRCMNQRYTWNSLVSRRYMEDGRCRIFQFQSGNRDFLASAQQILLPDTDWLRIHLRCPELPSLPTEELRFDCLRMMFQSTHTQIEVERDESTGTLLVRLFTRNRGLMNVVFILQAGSEPVNPFLLA